MDPRQNRLLRPCSGSRSTNLLASLSTTSGLFLPVGSTWRASIRRMGNRWHRLQPPIAPMSMLPWQPPVQLLRAGARRRVMCVRATCMPSRRSEEHTSELQSQSNIVCRLLLEKKKHHTREYTPPLNSPPAFPPRMPLHSLSDRPSFLHYRPFMPTFHLTHYTIRPPYYI